MNNNRKERVEEVYTCNLFDMEFIRRTLDQN